MNEKLLQFIWQFQYFNKQQLVTIDGNPITIMQHGTINYNQGPDFLSARIKIDNTIWAGNIELHVKSSDWITHKHAADINYNNVILHVVWQHDMAVQDAYKNNIATIELEPLVPKILLQQYQQLMETPMVVPCYHQLPVLSEMGWLAWKERLLVERLQRKSAGVLALLQQSNNHWEEVFWWQLAKNFGAKVNADQFQQMATSLPVNVLAKHKNQVIQLEALLMGQAGLLKGDFADDYPKLLQREYRFLAAKFGLTALPKSPDFLRMRPANFPTIRLAQLAMLVHKSNHLFSKVLEIDTMVALKHLPDITANDYWHYHYVFDESTAFKPKTLGAEMMNNIIINTIVPVLFAYGMHHKEQVYKDRAIQFLTWLKPEENAITKQWQVKQVGNTNAFDSQALIELKNNYCKYKHCLSCAVGNAILRKR